MLTPRLVLSQLASIGLLIDDQPPPAGALPPPPLLASLLAPALLRSRRFCVASWAARADASAQERSCLLFSPCGGAPRAAVALSRLPVLAPLLPPSPASPGDGAPAARAGGVAWLLAAYIIGSPCRCSCIRSPWLPSRPRGARPTRSALDATQACACWLLFRAIRLTTDEVHPAPAGSSHSGFALR